MGAGWKRMGRALEWIENEAVWQRDGTGLVLAGCSISLV